MRSKRYPLIITNRCTGSHLHVRLYVALCALAVTFLVGGGLMAWGLLMSADGFDDLKFENVELQLENASYRLAATEMSDQIATLQTAMSKLAVRVNMEPSIVESIERLLKTGQARAIVDTITHIPKLHTFTQLQGLLVALDDRLGRVRRGVAYREALAAAIPMMWPADGWITAGYGYRLDPFTGDRDFHPAVDISTEEGQPVYATATGRVFSAARNGPYGNLVEIDHGFGLTTRYGHLSKFGIGVGDTAQRGDIIGYVGATGRATGYHVHYEVRSDNRTINPMRLLAQPRHVSAN